MSVLPKLTAAEFLQHMSGMQAHYAPGDGVRQPAAAYELPAHVAQLALLHRPLPAAPGAAAPVLRSAGQAAVVVALRAAERDTLQFVSSHQNGMKAALADTAGFRDQMHKLEQQEIADHAARIQKLFAALIAAGNAHPGQQPHILMATNEAGAFLANLLRDAHAATHGIAGLLGGAAHATADTVRKAAEAAGHWASGAAQTVGHFFKSLF